MLLKRIGRLVTSILAVVYGIGLVGLTAFYFFNHNGPWVRTLAVQIPLRERGCGPCGACNKCFEKGGSYVQAFVTRNDLSRHDLPVVPASRDAQQRH